MSDRIAAMRCRISDIRNQVSAIGSGRFLSAARGNAFGFGQDSEGSAEKCFEVGGASLALGFRDGSIGGAVVIAKIDESGLDVGFGTGGRSGGGLFFFDGDSFELVLEFDDHAFGGLAAYAGNLGEAPEITAADGRNEFLDVHAGENFQG